MDDEYAALASRVAVAAGPGAVVDQIRPLVGGLSSRTHAAVLRRSSGAPEDVVIKSAPAGLAPTRNRDVLRQARVLRQLARVAAVRVPEVLLTDDGAPPEVPPLFVMRLVPGESLEPVHDDGPLPPPDALTHRALAAARMLAHLHAVHPASVGLGDEPCVDLLEEVARWERALDTVDDDLRPGHAECAGALRASAPAAADPSICHGDWRLGNMLCRGGSIEAVIDWEIWSVADARVDLAWFLANSVHDGNVFAEREAPGMPDCAGLLAAYEDERGEVVGDLRWFDALTAFKQAATMGLILKQNRRRASPDATVEAHAPRLPRLIQLAVDLLERAATP